MKVTFKDVSVEIPVEDEICSQEYLSIIEGEHEPGQHDFLVVVAQDFSKSSEVQTGLGCLLCCKLWPVEE